MTGTPRLEKEEKAPGSPENTEGMMESQPSGFEGCRLHPELVGVMVMLVLTALS